MSDKEQHKVPAEVIAELRPIIAERDALRDKLAIAERLSARAIRLAAAGCGLNPDKKYVLTESSEGATFTLEASNE